ncbi:MAG: DUF2179 domain-containing protein [Mycoplasmoidaceae bacterium]
MNTEKTENNISNKKEEKIQVKGSAGANFEKKFFKSSTLRLSKIYSITSKRQKYIMVILIGMMIGFLTLIFLKNTGLYSMGVTAITQGLSRIITSIMFLNKVDENVVNIVSDLTFWFFILIVNSPLLFFAKKHIGNQFTFLTLAYLLTSSIFPFLISLIPGIQNVLLFGDIKSVELTNLPPNITLLTWGSLDSGKVISLFFYSLAFPFLSVLLYTIVYAIGGSTGGSDIISIYYLKIKLKSLGQILIVINFFCVITGSFIGSYVSIGILENDWHYQNFFSPNLVCSIINFSIFGFLLQVLYPRFRMSSIKVFGKNIEKINEHLDSINCIHSRTISKAIGSYSKKEQYILEMYITIIELGPIIKEIRKIDNNAFIVINKNIEIDGNLSFPVFLR